MVRAIEQRGLVRDARVLAAAKRIRRDPLLPAGMESHAYEDTWLTIAPGVAEPPPSVQLLAVEAANVTPGQRVLDTFPGIGYRAAIAASVGGRVCCIALNPEHFEQLCRAFSQPGMPAVQVRLGSPADGWPDRGPYNVIFGVWDEGAVPPAILSQLRNKGRLVLVQAHMGRIVVLENQKTALRRLRVVSMGAAR